MVAVVLGAVFVLGVASAVTVWARSGDAVSQPEQALEEAPVFEPQVVEPVLHTASVERAGKGGCPYQEAKMQQVHVTPVEEAGDQLLTQLGP